MGAYERGLSSRVIKALSVDRTLPFRTEVTLRLWRKHGIY
jgi:hypothetical protein